MYSEQLEQLIKAAIADGVITEKERTVLHKKAAEENVGADEIDVYVDGLLELVKQSSPQNTNIDFKYVDKQTSGSHIFYYGKKLYGVNLNPNGFIQKMYLSFCKGINKEEQKYYLLVFKIYKKGYGRSSDDPIISINTKQNSFTLEYKYDRHLDLQPELIINPNRSLEIWSTRFSNDGH